MDKSLHALCDALTKITGPLNPRDNALSFLLAAGRTRQGKSSLLRQSGLRHYTVHAPRKSTIYYNANGIIVELGEEWVNQGDTLLQSTLRQLNRCQKGLRISGLLFCVDARELLLPDRTELSEHLKAHASLFIRILKDIGYPVSAELVFTRMDAIAGFCEFFQDDHASELQKPLGFSLAPPTLPAKSFASPLDHLVEVLSQQVIAKMHPARSGVKRTLIREFPLQVAGLRSALQIFLQLLAPARNCLQSVYFTSAEQGGTSVDRLNHKIRHEYALTVQDTFPQANNHRAFFIEGLIQNLQKETRAPVKPASDSRMKLTALIAIAGCAGLSGLLAWHFKTADVLDGASRELLRYEALAQQNANNPEALYHLARASEMVSLIPGKGLWLPTLSQLQRHLAESTRDNLRGQFLPTLIARMEQTLRDTSLSPGVRFDTLKMYLSLGDAAHFSRKDALLWFAQHTPPDTTEHARRIQETLLEQAFADPMQPIPIDHQLVSDTRNFFNALPPGYLYYALAKADFPKASAPLAVEGFQIPAKTLPVYFTRQGFEEMTRQLPQIALRLKAESWVLGSQDTPELTPMLLQAYAFEYVSWWQEFIAKSRPSPVHDYAAAQTLAHTLSEHQSFSRLLSLVREHTAPDNHAVDATFNDNVASKFADIHLGGIGSMEALNQTLGTLSNYLSTLAVLHDEGKTAFNLARARFEGESRNDPLSMLYDRVAEQPKPVSEWTRLMADDIWMLLLADTRNYLNHEWKNTVYDAYMKTIANRYPLDSAQDEEIAINDFDRFFSTHGVLNHYIDTYLRPFMDTSKAEWEPREVNGFRMPISPTNMEALIRANVIGNMFFSEQDDEAHIEFTLQKIALDPVISALQLQVGKTSLNDNQNSESWTRFSWPSANARLTLNAIDGNHYELSEQGPWAFFRILQKVNVLSDEEDSSSLQILFEVNGNSGRYVLKTQNAINPFTPGILNGFALDEKIA